MYRKNGIDDEESINKATDQNSTDLLDGKIREAKNQAAVS